jgi:hypothetical protein
MRAQWLRFGRKHAPAGSSGSDKRVVGAPTWLLCAVIIASTAALLGTSQASDNPATPDDTATSPTGKFVQYDFERNGIEGGTVDLTQAVPSASFYVSIAVDDFGPDGVNTTDGASAHLSGSLTRSGMTAGSFDYVSVDVSAPEASSSTLQANEQLDMSQTLQFSGDCENPKQGTCRAGFLVSFARNDEGASGGTINVTWTFSLHSSGLLPAAASSLVPAQDPPWTVEVMGP